MSFKKFQPEVRFNGEKIDPDEINRVETYTIACPYAETAGSAFVGTVAAGKSGDAAGAFVITNQQLDYPRNLKLTIVNTAGSLNAGTVAVTGQNQFGEAITENIGYALGTATQGKAGTKIFSKVTAATITWGTGQVQNGTAFLGVAGGTESGSNVFWLGLPVRIGAAADVVGLSWANNFVAKPLNAGTPSALIDTVNHSFTGTAVMGTADFYHVRVISSYNSENKPVLA